MAAPRAVILSGGGDYGDPWHPFAATSERLAAILRNVGHAVQICDQVAVAVADLSDADLIVVNAAGGPPADTTAAQAGLAAALERGIGVLAVHVGACTLLALPDWEPVTGASWIAGQSMHPPTGPSHIITYPGRHVIAGPVTSFSMVDERYAWLRTAPDIVPLAAHEHAGQLHPLIWARQVGASRVVTDLLGHDTRSYDSAEHRELVARAARWVTGAL
jgi:type 1 glutamine amidotransferase